MHMRPVPSGVSMDCASVTVFVGIMDELVGESVNFGPFSML